MTDVQMPRHRLAPGLSVHPFGISCGTAGADDHTVLAAMRAALEDGVNLFTAFGTERSGCLGQSERLLGRLLADHPGADIQVATHFGPAGSAPHRYAFPHLRHQLEQALDNLGAERIPVFVLPSLDFGPDDRYLEPAAETLGTFRHLGSVGAVGLCAPDPIVSPGRGAWARFTDVFDVVRPDIVVARYSPVLPAAPEEDIFAFATRRRVGLILRTPFEAAVAGGLTAGLPDGWKTAAAEELEPLRRRLAGLPGAEAALAVRYCTSRGPATAVLAASGSSEHVTQLAAALRRIGADDLTEAGAAYERIRARLASGSSELGQL
ncbi:aldo/keto reductase [Kitasatospora sp. NPDC087315]|uniref:aldo/keto reductase n=1 Tax=Kitasatospora sp. NPDC087315 TaxID=3364069 RepID=UPI00382E8F7A